MKQKKEKRPLHKRPKVSDSLSARDFLEGNGEWYAAQKTKPLNKAHRKLNDFVNTCVSDSDFRQSPELLRLLLVVRDVLADNPTEDWTLEDYLAPIVSGITSAASAASAEVRRESADENREAVLAERDALVANGVAKSKLATSIEERLKSTPFKLGVTRIRQILRDS